MKFNNALRGASQTSIRWVSLTVLFRISYAIWLERLSSLFSYQTNDTSFELHSKEL
jgi:hypothetical protein